MDSHSFFADPDQARCGFGIHLYKTATGMWLQIWFTTITGTLWRVCYHWPLSELAGWVSAFIFIRIFFILLLLENLMCFFPSIFPSWIRILGENWTRIQIHSSVLNFKFKVEKKTNLFPLFKKITNLWNMNIVPTVLYSTRRSRITEP